MHAVQNEGWIVGEEAWFAKCFGERIGDVALRIDIPTHSRQFAPSLYKV